MKIIKLLLRRSHMAAFLLLALLGHVGPLGAYQVNFVDSSGSQINVSESPRNVVSLVPATTDIILQLGAGDSLEGLTCHDTLPPEMNQKGIAGGSIHEHKDVFAAVQSRVLEEKRLRTKPVEIALDYVRSARVDETTIFDFPNKTLLVEFRGPMRVNSTLEGDRRGILTVGNHYYPPPCWSIAHRLGFEECRNRIYKAIGKSRKNSCFLFTGADMENLSVQKAQFRAMTVYALVTAGVASNAVRMSVDEGLFYEPGTINVILMTNMKLTPRAMARAIIAATEAKTAAMQDLDVRSSATPLRSQATGTGTDEVLVVEGKGTPIDNTGGHCKMGELIARAVYDGVKEAVSRQNGIVARRSVFRRLRERRIDLRELLEKSDCLPDRKNEPQDLARLEEILLQPRYASFMEAALALSDAYERGLVADLEPFQIWCRNVSEEIAGTWIEKWTDPITSEGIPMVIKMSLNALLNGLAMKETQLIHDRSPLQQ